MKTFPWKTIGGYDIYEVMSALQKSIRRGLQDDALFWASEMYMSEYESHAWVRLTVIASEDVGIADPLIAIQIRILRDTWKERKKEGDAKLYFVDAVLRLVRAPKSRIADHAVITYFEGDRPKKPIPDYALDVHTAQGRALNRGYEHFFNDGAQLANCVVADPYEEQARTIRK